MKVVISTCDSYAWLSPVFLHFYKKNWPDNPYQYVYLTETKNIDNAPTFCAGKIEWADRMLKYLETYTDEKLLILFDDYIIKSRVDTGIVRRAEDACMGDIGCLRLNAHDRLSCFLVDNPVDGFREYPHDKPYAISFQAAIWQRDFLIEFLRKGDTIWQTEIEGSKRVLTSKKKVLWTNTPAFVYTPHGYTQKGKVDPIVKQWVKENW